MLQYIIIILDKISDKGPIRLLKIDTSINILDDIYSRFAVLVLIGSIINRINVS